MVAVMCYRPVILYRTRIVALVRVEQKVEFISLFRLNESFNFTVHIDNNAPVAREAIPALLRNVLNLVLAKHYQKL